MIAFASRHNQFTAKIHKGYRRRFPPYSMSSVSAAGEAAPACTVTPSAVASGSGWLKTQFIFTPFSGSTAAGWKIVVPYCVPHIAQT